VPEAELPAVLEAYRRGKRPQVEAWDRSEAAMLATGTLQTIDNQIDTTTGTIKLRAQFDNNDEKLFPNQFVNMRLRVQTLQNATVIPAAAVQRASFGTFVYVVKPDNTVTIRRIDLGPAQGERVSIAKGLTVAEQVVLEGVDDLTEGAKVEVIPEGGVAPRRNAEGAGRRWRRRRAWRGRRPARRRRREAGAP
jgi:multidrug efflux system membrane fusion protein